MKIIYLSLFFATVSAGCSAENIPAVGLLEIVPVVGKDMRVNARPSYVFTTKKLTSPTTFTALQSQGKFASTICCYEVSNLNPVSIATELSKYSYDLDFVAHMKSINGYKYIYQTQPTTKSLWNQFMRDITPDTHDPMDSQLFSAPVIAATIRKDSLPATFEADHNKITFSTDYKNNSTLAVYTFMIGGQKITLSEELPSVE
jgi:hypothetical protein